MFRSQLFWRLFTGYVAIIVILTLAIGVMVSKQVTASGMSDIHRSLEVRSEYLAELSKQFLLEYQTEQGQSNEEQEQRPSTALYSNRLQALVTRLGDVTQSRLTIIVANGVVIADSQENPLNMDNHSDRPEVLAAKQSGHSTATRYSNTLQKNMIYRALKLTDNSLNHKALGYVRVSLPLSTIDEKLTKLQSIVIIAAAGSALAALILGLYLARHFSGPLTHMTDVAEAISQGDFNKRIVTQQTGEIGRLADAFNRMARNSENRMIEITGDRNRLAMIFTGMVEGVIGVDQHQNIIHINQAAANLLKISTTASIHKLIWEQVRIQEINQAVEEAVFKKGVVKTQVRRPSEGDDLVVDIYAAYLNDAQGDHLGTVIVLNDVSELDRLERVRRDFVANASHELKTPITAIRGLAETILEDPNMDSNIKISFIEKINAQSIRLSQLVTDLMTLSRLESELTDKEPKPVELSLLAIQSIGAIEHACTEKGIILKQKISANVKIMGDGQALSQMIDNLLDNAVKYTPVGGSINLKLGLTAMVSTTENTSDKSAHRADLTSMSHIKLTIKNSGAGISIENQKRLFERFYRVDKARSRELGGTGLGLSIVKNIAEEHGGSVSLKSKPGKGTKFSVILPR